MVRGSVPSDRSGATPAELASLSSRRYPTGYTVMADVIAACVAMSTCASWLIVQAGGYPHLTAQIGERRGNETWLLSACSAVDITPFCFEQVDFNRLLRSGDPIAHVAARS